MSPWIRFNVGMISQRPLLLFPEFQQVFPGKLRIPKNLRQQTGTDRLSGMNGNNGCSAIGMTKNHVTPLLSGAYEPALFRKGQEFLACENREVRHTAIR